MKSRIYLRPEVVRMLGRSRRSGTRIIVRLNISVVADAIREIILTQSAVSGYNLRNTKLRSKLVVSLCGKLDLCWI